MNQEKELEYTVNGYLFGDKDDVEAAKQELAAIQYIDKKIEGRDAETILSVYQASLEKKVFRTPVGYGYLHELQKRMVKAGIKKNEIPGIPLFQVYNDHYKEDIKPVRVVRRIEKKDDKQEKLNISIIVNIVLGILVVALFLISLTGNNPNILNYRNTVVNEYSTWEEELQQREQAVREKEKELQIDNSQSTDN